MVQNPNSLLMHPSFPQQMPAEMTDSDERASEMYPRTVWRFSDWAERHKELSEDITIVAAMTIIRKGPRRMKMVLFNGLTFSYILSIFSLTLHSIPTPADDRQRQLYYFLKKKTILP